MYERIRGTTKEGEIAKKVQESRLKWYGGMLSREEDVGKGVMVMEVPGKRRRGRGCWITSGTTCRRKNCRGRKRKTKFNGGVS